MYRIYKYELKIINEQLVEMPVDSTILSVHSQNNRVMMWAKVRVELQGSVPMHWVRIGVFGTGHNLSDDTEGAIFIGTVLTDAEQPVWHVWEMP